MRTALPILLLLTGCATAGDLAQEPAKISLQSAKSPDNLEECISLALASAGTPNVIRGPGRRTLDFNSGGLTMWTVTIIEAQPSVVEVRWKGPLNARWRDGIRNCA